MQRSSHLHPSQRQHVVELVLAWLNRSCVQQYVVKLKEKWQRNIILTLSFLPILSFLMHNRETQINIVKMLVNRFQLVFYVTCAQNKRRKTLTYPLPGRTSWAAWPSWLASSGHPLSGISTAQKYHNKTIMLVNLFNSVTQMVIELSNEPLECKS